MKLKKIVSCGTYGLVGLHVVCCGFPLLAAVLGVASPFAGLFSPAVMNILFIAAGVFMIISWFNFLYGCECHKRFLVISTILFITSLTLHFIVPHFTGAPSCH